MAIERTGIPLNHIGRPEWDCDRKDCQACEPNRRKKREAAIIAEDVSGFEHQPSDEAIVEIAMHRLRRGERGFHIKLLPYWFHLVQEAMKLAPIVRDGKKYEIGSHWQEAVGEVVHVWFREVEE